MVTVENYVKDIVKTYGIDGGIEKTKQHIEVANSFNAVPATLQFLNAVHAELLKLKGNS